MAKSQPALDFKSTSFYALKLQLNSADSQLLLAELDQKILAAGDFYTDEPIVIDASGLDTAPDWQAISQALISHQLHPIGVQVNTTNQASARQAGMTIIDTGIQSGRPDKSPAANNPTPVNTPAEPQPAAAKKTMLVRQPLRSGQSIYAKDSDLIVIGMVSQGAEVIADGNIHVYGPLRGKAIAGAQGDIKALILTTQLDPELLAIAGIYRVIETQLPKDIHNQPAQVELNGGTLCIKALNGARV